MKKSCLSCVILLFLAGWVQTQAYNFPVITTGTGTYVYQRDVSSNKDGISILSEAMVDHCAVTASSDRSWLCFSGTSVDVCGIYYRFQAPTGYSITHARVQARSFIKNISSGTISMSSYWLPTYVDYPWDYYGSGSNCIVNRSNSLHDQAIVDYADDVEFDVNSAQMAIGFLAYQNDWDDQNGSKGWFWTDNSDTYDPGLIITLTVKSNLKGDINNDGVVDTNDLGELEGLIHFGTTDLTYDLNGDGIVNQTDVDYLAHDILHIPVTNNIITLGTDSTYTYKRDISPNKDDQTPLYEAIFDHAGITSDGSKSWVNLEGTTDTLGVYYKFQAPDGYRVKSAHVVARSFMNNGPDNVSMNAYWSTSFPQNVWDYWSANKFISRTNPSGDGSIQTTYTDDVTLDVNSPQLAIGFTASQSNWNNQHGSKGWFVTDDSNTYDPGLIITLSMEPLHYIHKILEDFEGTAADWTMPESNSEYTVSKQNDVKYEGNTALDFHVNNTGTIWCRTKGILASAQDWTNYNSITLEVKSSVPGAVGWIGWDWLIIGTDDMYRVNGNSGCGSFTLPYDTDWHTITLDLTPYQRSNVTALEFYITTGSCISGSFDLYFDDIQLMTATQSPPGDANCDGKVDVSDLGILAANYGKTTSATWATGDFNNDGKVDVSDLGILAANYGSGTGSSLDFNADAKALGLAVGNNEAKAETDQTPVTSAVGCGSAGLPLIAGLLLAGFMLGGVRVKE